MTNRRAFLVATLPLLLAGCAGLRLAPPDPRREAVDRLFSRLQGDLSRDRWDSIHWAFSPDFRDLPLVRDRWQDRWTNTRTVALELIPGRILESDGLLNVRVDWHRVLRDAAGRFIKAGGSAEVILEPFRKGYRIRQILGDSFL